jgi:DNA-binding NtrC family response regulator
MIKEKTRMPIIEVRKGTELIGSFVLTEDIITIGRGGSNDIVLPDAELRVSRYHAVLLRNPYDPEGYIMRDLSSNWGTKIRGEYIFQRLLENKDIIHILDFQLVYVTSSPVATGVLFQINDEISNAHPLSLSCSIGELATVTHGLDSVLGNSSAGVSHGVKLLFEELLCQIKEPVMPETLLESTVDVLFRTFKITKGGSVCFAFSDGEGGFRPVALRGMEKRVSISMSRSVIEDLKAGRTVKARYQLWIPLTNKGNRFSGFLLVSRDPYGPVFTEEEIRTAIFAGRIASNVIGSTGRGAVDEHDMVQWPRAMVGGDRVLREIERVAALNVNVLLLGETGVGKEVAAKEIHRLSRRSDKIFRTVHCPNLPENLAESELFGHRKGAFTGAVESKKGEFEIADGGTIFLDELADLPWKIQRNVLRAIREKVIKRVNEEQERHVDVRVIAATNRDLAKEMEEGRFGSDLFHSFRECVALPPLKERKRDIPLLGHFFLDKFAHERETRTRGITPQAMRYLLAYSWPGNIRELENCISEALSRSKGLICFQHLPDKILALAEPETERAIEEPRKPSSLEEAEKAHIIEILQHTRGNKARAVGILKISKPTLYNKMRQYGIPSDFGKAS